MLVCTCPGAMRDVGFAGTSEPCTLWIRTRESGISLLRWRRQCHNSPPVARNGRKDTGSTPVSPRYYSPGLPEIAVRRVPGTLPAGRHTEDQTRLQAGKAVDRRAHTPAVRRTRQRRLPDTSPLSPVSHNIVEPLLQSLCPF